MPDGVVQVGRKVVMKYPLVWGTPSLLARQGIVKSFLSFLSFLLDTRAGPDRLPAATGLDFSGLSG
jgi:hypothetical protein